MKFFAVQLLVLLTDLVAASAADPVREYLSSFSPLGGDNRVYSDDRLLRLDLDLNNDGQVEMLLSMARDRDGKQGNVWTAYAKEQNDYRPVGGLTFNANRFYLGDIEEIHRYGLVTFGPSGGGEGMVSAYLFDGSRIREVQITGVSRDQQTRELNGLAVRNKYFREKATTGSEVATVIDAAALSREYGIKVEGTTYRQTIENFLANQANPANQAATSPAVANASPSTAPSYSPTREGPTAASTPLGSAAPQQRKPLWLWIISLSGVVVFGFLVWKRLT